MEEDEHGEMVQRYRLPRQSLVANVASQSGKKLLALAPCKLHSLHALHLGGALESEGHRRCDADHSTSFFFFGSIILPAGHSRSFPRTPAGHYGSPRCTTMDRPRPVSQVLEYVVVIPHAILSILQNLPGFGLHKVVVDQV